MAQTQRRAELTSQHRNKTPSSVADTSPHSSDYDIIGGSDAYPSPSSSLQLRRRTSLMHDRVSGRSPSPNFSRYTAGSVVSCALDDLPKASTMYASGLAFNGTEATKRALEGGQSRSGSQAPSSRPSSRTRSHSSGFPRPQTPPAILNRQQAHQPRPNTTVPAGSFARPSILGSQAHALDQETQKTRRHDSDTEGSPLFGARRPDGYSENHQYSRRTREWIDQQRKDIVDEAIMLPIERERGRRQQERGQEKPNGPQTQPQR